MHDPHYDRAAVYAKRSYTPGEEVTEYYGGWNMADTLLSAGYLPAPAAAGEDPAVSDCALLNLSPPDETKASALRDAGFETPWRVCLSRPTRFARGATRRRVGGRRRGRCRGPIGRRGRRWVVLPRVASRRGCRQDARRAWRNTRPRPRRTRMPCARTARSSRRWRRRRGRRGGGEAEAEAERARRLTRVALATELRAREKRTMSRILSDLRDAGGDAFAWADPDYAATEQARMEREERGVEEEDEEDEAESAWAEENVTSSAKAREEL